MQDSHSIPIHKNQAFIEAAIEWLHESTTTMEQALKFYESTANTPGCDDWTLAQLGKGDRFFLGVHLCGRADLAHPWLYARCREVESASDGFLDLWFREGYKSTIITFLGSIQEILRDPEITICILSHTKSIAKKFMLQIKQELESNETLKKLYPDILYEAPQKDSSKWTEESLTVKRKQNPKENTIECSGLVDGMPTGAHYLLRIYDDVVTPASVSTPEQASKTLSMFELSDNLGARGIDGKSRAWVIGTKYHYNDAYTSMVERGSFTPRIYPATDNGLPNGKPVFFSEEVWADKKIKQGPSTIACQMLQNPAAGNEAMFKKDWLSFIEIRPATMNVYIMCDPAGSKKKGSDNTAMAVIGVDAGQNRYLLDGYCHKMSLSERWTAMSGLRKVWAAQPGVQMVKVGYEKYGMQSDLEYFEEKMQSAKDAFEIIELNWVNTGSQSKIDRIQRLQPDFQAKKFYLAAVTDGETANQRRIKEQGQGFRIFAPVKRRDHEGNLYSLNKRLLDEFLVYPFAPHDDMLDVCSRLYDMEPVPPIIIDERVLEPMSYCDGA